MPYTLTLDDLQADELRALLDQALGDLSYEITATDNPSYRAALRQRREALAAARAQLDHHGH